MGGTPNGTGNGIRTIVRHAALRADHRKATGLPANRFLSQIMKTTQLLRPLFTLTVVAGLITGCASPNYKKGASTAVTMDESSGLIAIGNTRIDESIGSLNDLVAAPNPDLRPQFQRFNTAVHDLRGSAADIAGKAAQMKIQGAEYFAGWDRELAKMANEDIRSRSETRRNEVAARFDRISLQYDYANTAFQPLLSDLRDVEKFLSTDLTIGGLVAVKSVAAKATADAVPVKESLARLSEEFKNFGVSISPTTASR